MKVRVYLDNSVVSKALENELNELGIEFTPVREDKSSRPLPALETNRVLIRGLNNIRRYFLHESPAM